MKQYNSALKEKENTCEFSKCDEILNNWMIDGWVGGWEGGWIDE